MNQFEKSSKCYDSKLVDSTVVVHLGAHALEITTEAKRRLDFLELLESVDRSPDVLGYVLINDSAFDGTADLQELIKFMEENDAPYFARGGYRGMLHDVIAARFRHSIGDLMIRMSKFGKPAVAGFQGRIRSEYLGFTLIFDSRFATADTTFSFDNVQMGIPASPGVTFLMPRFIGEGKTLSLLNRGATIDAEEAQSLGLITDIVERLDDLEDRCIKDIRDLTEHNRHIAKSHRKLILPTPKEISFALERYYKVAAESIIAIRSDQEVVSK
jgi:enoyl-CoA hydratase/carnithine racemase